MTAKKSVSGKPEYLYGIHAVTAVLEYRPQQVMELNVRHGERSTGVSSLVEKARQQGISISEVSPSQLKRFSTDGVHQGVAALVEPRPDLADSDLETFLLDDRSKFFLVLDTVDDPRNLGACLRVADGAGVDAVVIARSRGANITPLVAKVACGAAESVACYRVANLARALGLMAAAGVQIVGASGGEQQSVYDIDVAVDTALVVGHEGSGLRRLTRNHCDQLASLPMRGAVDSLNVSVAAGVMLYEIQRKREQLPASDC